MSIIINNNQRPISGHESQQVAIERSAALPATPWFPAKVGQVLSISTFYAT
jgi:hypothetical protein